MHALTVLGNSSAIFTIIDKNDKNNKKKPALWVLYNLPANDKFVTRSLIDDTFNKRSDRFINHLLEHPQRSVKILSMNAVKLHRSAPCMLTVPTLYRVLYMNEIFVTVSKQFCSYFCMVKCHSHRMQIQIFSFLKFNSQLKLFSYLICL